MTQWKETNDPPWESQGVPRPHCSHSARNLERSHCFPCFGFFYAERNKKKVCGKKRERQNFSLQIFIKREEEAMR